MTGNVAVDIALGLVFIFLIYSLLASVIQEIVATLLGLRARNLRHAIRRMLEDENANNKSTEEKKIFKRKFTELRKWKKRVISKEDTDLVKDFYDQPVIKYLASNAYFSRPSYLKKSDFSLAILEILKNKAGSNASNIDKIKEVLSDENKTINEDTKKHLKALLDDAQNDLVKFRANIENWFSSTMERAAGWYKRTIQFNLTVIGFVMAVLFNINTIEIVRLLSTDKDIRDSMVQLAVATTENKDIKEVVEKIKLKNSTDLLPKTVEKKLDSLFNIYEKLEAEAIRVNNLFGFQTIDSLHFKGDSIHSAELDTIKKSLSPKQKIVGEKYIIEFPSVYLANKTGKFYYIERKKDKNGKFIDTHAKFKTWAFFWNNFWGYLITALAISLGAPFWFDLLNKLARIRSSIKNDLQQDKEIQSTVLTKQRVG
ncbi:MAG: hypothetical protein JXQ93_10175 [Flavobacteriaceae bacterium]